MSHIWYVLTYVFNQLAVGALIALVMAEYLVKDKKTLGSYEIASYIPIPAAIIGVIAICIPVLPQILNAYRLIFNITSSRMSMEVIVTVLFIVLALVYTLLWVCHPEYGSLRKKVGKIDEIADMIGYKNRLQIGTMAAVMGVALLFISGFNYVLPSQPVWNHYTTPLFFMVPALTLGPAAMATALSIKYKKAAKKEQTEYKKLLGTYLGFAWKLVLGATIVLIILQLLYLQFLQSPSAGIAGLMTVEQILDGEHTTLFLLRVATSMVIALVLLAGVAISLKAEAISRAATLSIGLFIVLFVGELLGRTLFFEACVHFYEVAPHLLL